MGVVLSLFLLTDRNALDDSGKELLERVLLSVGLEKGHDLLDQWVVDVLLLSLHLLALVQVQEVAYFESRSLDVLFLVLKH